MIPDRQDVFSKVCAAQFGTTSCRQPTPNPPPARPSTAARLSRRRTVGLAGGHGQNPQAGGHEIVLERNDDTFAFGGAPVVRRIKGGYVAGSDPRKDGQALAW